ncbi:ATP-binding protein, partial [Streptomyces sp. SID3343]|uniref:ATP-binding protein n=1 Tax=Streptomyces sp. SID3343 TaxID=2690260 RepID=UPI00136B2390|nr:hypothetical protein [Streptomyces sp. SID3343]
PPDPTIPSGRSWEVPRARGAPAVARAGVTRELAAWGWPRERVQDVVLAVSEVVGNALRHTTGPVRLTLT